MKNIKYTDSPGVPHADMDEEFLTHRQGSEWWYSTGYLNDESGKYRRLNNYTIEPLGFTEAGGYKFSNGWKLTMKGVKDEEYTITPKTGGQFNLFFFELLAEIKNKDGRLVGYSVTELLPGVYNEKLESFRAFRNV